MEAGVSRTAIWRAENGLGVRLLTIELLAMALGVPASELIGCYAGEYQRYRRRAGDGKKAPH